MDYSLEYYKNMFRVKFDELERCHKELSNYAMIQASNPIRSLLLDSHPLVDILNREKHLPITYCVNNQPWHDESEMSFALLLWKEINPFLSDNNILLKKDAFLKVTCVYFLGQPVTVRDIIKFYAYVRGGVHLDDGSKEYDSLREAFQTIKLNSLSSLDHSMRGIVQVIYQTIKSNKELLLS